MSVKRITFFKRLSFPKYLQIPSIFLLFLFIFYLFYENVKNNTINKFNAEQLVLAKTASQGITSFLNNYVSFVSFVAKQDEIIHFSEKGKKMMKDYFDTHKDIVDGITRVDATGTIMHTYPYKETLIGKDISNQQHVQQVIATKKPVMSDVFMSVQGYYAIALHIPIFNEKEYAGSLALLIPMDKLGKLFLDNIKPNKSGYAWLITENNIEIYCPIKEHIGKSFSRATENENNSSLLQKIKKENSGFIKNVYHSGSDKNTENQFVVYYKSPHGNTYWTTLISYNEKEVYFELSKFRKRLTFIFSLLFLAVIYYFYSLAKAKTILKAEKERKKAEILLKESNERFNSFMNNTPVYAYIKDTNLKIIYENKKTGLLSNSKKKSEPLKEIFGEQTAKMLTDADNAIIAGKKENIALVFSFDSDEKTKWFKEFKFRIKFSKNKYAVGGAVFDITEMKNYETELEHHKKYLEVLVSNRTKELKALYEESKEQKEEIELTLKKLKETQSRLIQSEKMASLGVLIAGISHEINNPLQYLSGVFYGLEQYFEKYGTEDKETTDLLLSSTKVSIDRISAIVKGLNHFSRDNDRFDEDCDIHSIIENSLSVLHNKYKYNITIEKKYYKEAIVTKGNVGKLHQVFINILTNSIQAIENTGTITINTTVNTENVIVEITDTGKGIHKEYLTKIMDPFFTTKEPGEGTGLGLSICYSIIKDHQGKIEFESELNKGTKTKIILPLKK
ncbi:MAG: GHKL domain-containing protein [Flavobacteriaceae bacterium]|nr:GHKL domain-containing protein [Flavobacteriaceae bacterium]